MFSGIIHASFQKMNALLDKSLILWNDFLSNTEELFFMVLVQLKETSIFQSYNDVTWYTCSYQDMNTLFRQIYEWIDRLFSPIELTFAAFYTKFPTLNKLPISLDLCIHFHVSWQKLMIGWLDVNTCIVDLKYYVHCRTVYLNTRMWTLQNNFRCLKNNVIYLTTKYIVHTIIYVYIYFTLLGLLCTLVCMPVGSLIKIHL